MKNLFSSPNIDSDLQNFSKDIKLIQQQLIDLRIDISHLNKQIRTTVKGIALLVSTPDSDPPSADPQGDDDVTEDNREGG